MAKRFIQFAAFNGFLAVIIGAFGAHALRADLTADLMHAYETAVQYHFWHALALLFVGLMANQKIDNKYLIASGLLFSLGLILFSGSLYFLAISDIRTIVGMPVGIITPIGGFMFILAWLLLLIASFKL